MLRKAVQEVFKDARYQQLDDLLGRSTLAFQALLVRCGAAKVFKNIMTIFKEQKQPRSCSQAKNDFEFDAAVIKDATTLAEDLKLQALPSKFDDDFEKHAACELAKLGSVYGMSEFSAAARKIFEDGGEDGTAASVVRNIKAALLFVDDGFGNPEHCV